MNKQTSILNIAVIGSGLAGLTAAFAMAKQNHNITVCAPRPLFEDGRSTALMSGSIDFLKTLGIWNEIVSTAFPLKTMRIIDDTKRLIRAPQTDFVSSEIDLEDFGYNVLNANMLKVLMDKLTKMTNVKFVEQKLSDISINQNATATITLNNGSQLNAELIIAADGKNSPSRKAVQIDVKSWQYPQIALVANISHTLPHDDVSTEFHTPTGPFTLVPLGNKKSSFVCVENEDGAARLKELSKTELALELERRMHSILGKIELTTKLQSFPLSALMAKQYNKDNIILIGEAAHAFPPIGAQGLNLGIRDIETLYKLLTQEKAAYEIAAQYSKERSIDITTRTTSVDLLNRSLLTDFLPVQITRSLGLYTLGNIAPLRRLAMNEGIAPGRSIAKAIMGFSRKN